METEGKQHSRGTERGWKERGMGENKDDGTGLGPGAVPPATHVQNYSAA